MRLQCGWSPPAARTGQAWWSRRGRGNRGRDQSLWLGAALFLLCFVLFVGLLITHDFGRDDNHVRDVAEMAHPAQPASPTSQEMGHPSRLSAFELGAGDEDGDYDLADVAYRSNYISGLWAVEPPGIICDETALIRVYSDHCRQGVVEDELHGISRDGAVYDRGQAMQFAVKHWLFLGQSLGDLTGPLAGGKP